MTEIQNSKPYNCEEGQTIDKDIFINTEKLK